MTVRVTRKVRRVLAAIHALDQALGAVHLPRVWARFRVPRRGQPGARTLPRTFYHLTYRGQLGAGLESTRQP